MKKLLAVCVFLVLIMENLPAAKAGQERSC
jgi:hypothetical protein